MCGGTLYIRCSDYRDRHWGLCCTDIGSLSLHTVWNKRWWWWCSSKKKKKTSISSPRPDPTPTSHLPIASVPLICAALWPHCLWCNLVKDGSSLCLEKLADWPSAEVRCQRQKEMTFDFRAWMWKLGGGGGGGTLLLPPSRANHSEKYSRCLWLLYFQLPLLVVVRLG